MRTLMSATIAMALSGCGPSEEPLLDTVEVEVDESILTKVTIRWTTETASTGSVAYGDGGALSEVAVSDGSGTEHEVVLRYLRAGQDYEFEVTSESSDGELGSGVLSFTTGYVPSSLPAFSVTQNEEDAPEMSFVGSVISTPSAPILFDSEGYYRWWIVEEEAETIARARLSHDGETLLYLATGSNDKGSINEVRRVDLDTGSYEALETPMAHHDFIEFEDGTVAYLGQDTRYIGETRVVADRLVELAPDGTQTTIWDTWRDYDWDPDFEAIDGSGWSHANALDYIAEEDAYLVSLRNFDAIVKLDGESGEILWQFGGEDSDFELTSGEFTSSQHQFELTENGLLVFDNSYRFGDTSRAVEYALDEDTMTAEEIWSYVPSPGLYCFGLGDVHRLEDGNTVVTWSTSGQMDMITPEGDVVWRMNGDLGAGFGYMTRIEEPY